MTRWIVFLGSFGGSLLRAGRKVLRPLGFLSLLQAVSPETLHAQLEVPVVVHIISRNPDAVTDAMVEKGIEDLNDAFAHRKKYAAAGPGYNTGISFCLAKRNPQGGNTTGITRTKSVLGDFDRDIEDLRMKGLVSWDNTRYCNIWFVDSLKTEILPLFECGKWKRSSENGYATFREGKEFWDGVVVNTFGEVLAHNMGHYLGLVHTFLTNECGNNNCAVDGDGICDTPPSNVASAPCGASVNSCSSDTVNSQGPDLPDLTGNFMTYGECTYSFTKGQSDRMKAVLGSKRNSLLWAGRCDPACPSENVLAKFTRDNWFPVPGDAVTFSNTGSNGANFSWTVDGVPVTGGQSMTHVFPATGKYAVTLKVFNGNPSCFGSQTDSILVTCGVMARYFPDKRVIASRAPILLDEVVFTNRSVPLNATFEWRLGNNGTLPEKTVSTDRDLRYIFPDSGTFVIRLIATVGGCTDTTLPYKLRVDDPAVDANIELSRAECLDDSKVRIRMQICNAGYSTMPAKVPVSFYDDDPLSTPAKRLGEFLIPDELKGKCCIQYDHVLDVGQRGLNQLFALVNDDGSRKTPFTLLEPPPDTPNTNARIPELKYANNMAHRTGFAFRVKAVPSAADLVPDSVITIQATVGQDAVGYAWQPSAGLSCTGCLAPQYRAGFMDETLVFSGRNAGGCTDTARVSITVPPWNDFRISIDEVECHSPGKVAVDFTLCNDFAKAYIPAGLIVTFYQGDPSVSGAATAIGTVFTTPAQVDAPCATYTHVLPGGATGTIYAVVNAIGTVPFVVPAVKEFQEKQYANNIANRSYAPRGMAILPPDTVVMRRQILPVRIVSSVYDPASVRWTAGSGLQIACPTGCPATTVTVLGNDTLRVRMNNRFSCVLDTFVVLRILPPDVSIKIDSVRCYSDRESIVDFTLCNGNGYDTIPGRLPVLFFGGSPGAGTPLATFRTAAVTNTPCAAFSQVIPTPPGGRFHAVVNQKAGSPVFTGVFAETDSTNNIDSARAFPFSVAIIPPDTSVTRKSRLDFGAASTGGRISAYNWQPAATLSCTTCPNPSMVVPFTTTVILQARNEFTCTATDTSVIRTFTDGRFHIPTAFTPNKDGLNDVFYLMGGKDVSVIRDFAVYDRYGQRVFHRTDIPANDPAYGWDGTRGGREAPSGNFVYVILVEFFGGALEPVKGLVTLIR